MKEHYKQRLNENEGPQTIRDVFNIIRRGENAQQIKDMMAARFNRARRLAGTARALVSGNPREISPVMLGIPGDPNTPADRAWSSTFERENRKPLKRSDAYKASLKRIAAGVLAGALLPGSIMGVAGLRAHRELGRNMEAQRQAEIGVQRARGDLQDTALGLGRGMYKVNEGRGEPDTRELDRHLDLLNTAFIGGYPRGPMHRAEVRRAERVRGAINPHRPGSIEMAMARGLLPAVPADLARSFLALNKDQAAELEEPSRSKSKGDPRHLPSHINTLRMNSEFYRALPTFPTRSNPLGTVPGYLANNQPLAGHHRQSAAAWRYSPTGETEYYDPTRHPHNPRNLSQAAVDIARLRRGDLLGNVSREDLEKIFRLRQDHKAQRRSGGPRTGGKSLSEHRSEQQGEARMNLKEQYKQRMLEEKVDRSLDAGTISQRVARDPRLRERLAASEAQRRAQERLRGIDWRLDPGRWHDPKIRFRSNKAMALQAERGHVDAEGHPISVQQQAAANPSITPGHADSVGFGISRRERGISASYGRGPTRGPSGLTNRQMASRIRKELIKGRYKASWLKDKQAWNTAARDMRARGEMRTEHYKQRLEQRMLEEAVTMTPERRSELEARQTANRSRQGLTSTGEKRESLFGKPMRDFRAREERARVRAGDQLRSVVNTGRSLGHYEEVGGSSGRQSPDARVRAARRKLGNVTDASVDVGILRTARAAGTLSREGEARLAGYMKSKRDANRAMRGPLGGKVTITAAGHTHTFGTRGGRKYQVNLPGLGMVQVGTRPRRDLRREQRPFTLREDRMNRDYK